MLLDVVVCAIGVQPTYRDRGVIVAQKQGREEQKGMDHEEKKKYKENEMKYQQR